MFLRERHARPATIAVVRPRQKNLPSRRRQQRLQSQRPVQREFLFVDAIVHAGRARVLAAVPGSIAITRFARTDQAAHERLDVLLQVERVNNGRSSISCGSNPRCNSSPSQRAKAVDLNHEHARLRRQRIQHRVRRNFPHHADSAFTAPTIERDPGLAVVVARIGGTGEGGGRGEGGWEPEPEAAPAGGSATATFVTRWVFVAATFQSAPDDAAEDAGGVEQPATTTNRPKTILDDADTVHCAEAFPTQAVSTVARASCPRGGVRGASVLPAVSRLDAT